MIGFRLGQLAALPRFILTRQVHTEKWPKIFNYEVAQKIESHWRPVLEEAHKKYVNEIKSNENVQKKYILSMFPYPSGRLHLGHVRVYTLSDVLARFNRMNGYHVIHPIGWDSFGLPAENAAIERNIKPDVWTESNIEYMRNQLKELSFSFDWERELSTCHESYYRWTQHLFLQLYLKGIVVRKEALVNWDPVDKTVLANEQIDESGRSWRSGAIVEKKILHQWFIKSSVYAQSLLDSMDSLQADGWEAVKSIQKMWIGHCDGCFVDFKFQDPQTSLTSTLSVFTKHPHAIYGVSHIDLNKHHILFNKTKLVGVDEQLAGYAVNPLTNAKLPVFLRSDDQFGELNANGIPRVDSKLGIPSFDANDRKFALDKQLSYQEVYDPAENKLINSKDLNGLNCEAGFEAACRELKAKSLGGFRTSAKLNDWCISRQRYWGTPIPLVNCSSCGVVPVPFDQLPVRLPPEAQNLKDSSWLDTKCPKCNGAAKRESDTMDTFMDSSWYYLRYLDVTNPNEPFGRAHAFKFMPVDVYIGGIEHAMTHLFVSRLMTHFLHDEKQVPSREPFERFVAMGMVKGETFKTKEGRYVGALEIESKWDVGTDSYFQVHKTSGERLAKEFEKMSKSKMNGIDPQTMIQKYGVDFTRFFLLSFVHPKSDRNFILSDDMIQGTWAQFQRIWELVDSVATYFDEPTDGKDTKRRGQTKPTSSQELYKTRNMQLSMIDFNLNENFNIPSYLVAISKIIKFLKKSPLESYREDERFGQLLAESLVILAPAAPHFANECWSRLRRISHLSLNGFNKDKLITEQSWPKVDSDWPVKLYFMRNGKSLGSPVTITAGELDKLNSQGALQILIERNNKKAKVDGDDDEKSLAKARLHLEKSTRGSTLSIHDR